MAVKRLRKDNIELTRDVFVEMKQVNIANFLAASAGTGAQIT